MGTRQSGNDNEPEIEVEEGGFEPIDPTGEEELLQEGLPGVRLKFESVNHTLFDVTDGDGRFSIPLPTGNFTITTDDPYYYDFSYWIEIPENPVPITDFLLSQQFIVTPREVPISFTFFSDLNWNGALDQGEEVGDLPVEFSTEIEQLGIISENIQDNGTLTLDLYPTTYHINIDHLTQEFDMDVEYGMDEKVDLEVGADDPAFELMVTKKLTQDSQVVYQDELGFDHPASNVTVEFIPVLQPGVLTGAYYSVTDDEGNFNISVYEGDYTISISAQIGDTNYAYHDRYLCTPSNPLDAIRIRRSVNITGHVTDLSGTTVADLPISITNLNTNATINVTTDKNGKYNAYLIPDTGYDFLVDHHLEIDDKDVLHRYTGQITASELNKTFDFRVSKYFRMSFTVYYDENTDDVNEDSEKVPGVTIHFSSNDSLVPWEYQEVKIETNSSGGILVYLPYGSYRLFSDSSKFKKEVRGTTHLDISYNSATERDIELVAQDVQLTGWTRYYSDPENAWFSDYTNLKGTVIRFIPVVSSNLVKEVTETSKVGGVYSATLYPASYVVHAYNKNSAVYAHLGVLEVSHETSPVFNVSLQKGDDVKGAVFFYDTNQTLKMNISQKKGLTLYKDDADLNVDIVEGTFQVYLPEGDIFATASYDNFEFDKDMTYSISTDLNVSRDHEDMAAYSLELAKEEDYSLYLDFNSKSDFKVMRSPNETVYYKLKVKNIGNVLTGVEWEVSNLPTGWKIEYGQDQFELDINEEMIAQVNVTLSDRPLALNNIDLAVKTTQGSGRANLMLGIDSPKEFDFDFNIPGDADNGVYFNSDTDYNISISNEGNTGDKILIMLDESGDNLEEWNVTVQDPQGEDFKNFGPEGINISIPEFETRNLTLSIKAPNSSRGNLNDRLDLTFTASSIFFPDLGTKTKKISLQVRRANLYFVEGSRKVENKGLGDHKHEFTVKVTVGSENIEVAPSADKPLCKLFWKDKEVGSEVVDFIEEDGTVDIEFTLNATMRDMVNETVKFKLILDDDEEIPETNEDDNVERFTVEVGEVTAWWEEIPWIAIVVAVVILAVAGVAFYWWRRRSIYT
jgi:hypothetical protein